MGRCSGAGARSSGGGAAASISSARALYWISATGGSRRFRFKIFGFVGLFRIGQQSHAQFGLFERVLAIAVQGDAAFVGFERIVQALFALFHLADQLLEFVEGFFEVGDAIGFGWL